MEIRPKSSFEIRNKSYIYNSYFNKKINQSPKISPNKIRDILYGKKLLSLIDINEKITNSKGASLLNQFKRLSQEEIKNCLE